MRKDTFVLGRVVTVVYGRFGSDLMDWASADERDAREWASETSTCHDVDFVAFYGRQNKNPQIFVDGHKSKVSLLEGVAC